MQRTERMIQTELRWEALSARTESITSGRVDLPPVRLIERQDGRIEAAAGFSLSSVALSKEGGARGSSVGRHQHLLWPGMSEGQQIEFVYTSNSSRCAEAREPFSFRIIARADGVEQRHVINNVHRLCSNVAVSLASAEDLYRFIPVAPSERTTPKELEDLWITSIKPLGLAIHPAPSRQFGFATPAMKTTLKNNLGVLLPMTAQSPVDEPRSPVFTPLLSNTSLTLMISVRLIELSNLELAALAQSLKWLNDGQPKCIRYDAEIRTDLEDEPLLDAARKQLRDWLRKPVGYNVSCILASADQLPPALIGAIGEEVFRQQPVLVSTVRPGTSGSNSRADASAERLSEFADLRSCVNVASDLPVLLPDPSRLLEVGVRRFYPRLKRSHLDTGLMLGRFTAGGSEVRLAQAGRTRSTYICGSTGSGKSSLMLNMIVQDMQNGEGVCVIDPHGSIYASLLEMVPSHRTNDVVLIDPCDAGYAVGLNFLEVSEGPQRHIQTNFVVNELIKILDRLYDLRQTGGPIFEQYMRAALLLVIDNAITGSTLMDIPLLFEEPEYRSFLVARCSNPYVVNFWSKQAARAMGDSSLANLAPYITSKLNQFTTNPLLRPIIGQAESTIDFRKAMDTGKILLVNLSKGLIGELDAHLLGMLILAKIFSAAMGRVDLAAQRHRPFFVYLDECQNFITDTIGYLLSESRKFGLSLILASQSLSQLSTNNGKQNVLDAVLTNCANLLLFRLGFADAERMEAYTRPDLDARDLQELPDYHVTARLLVNNAPSRPFVFETLAVTPPHTTASAANLISRSRAQFTTPVDAVEEGIIKRRKSLEDGSDEPGSAADQ
jgi:TraM recognition site of TraD and TraG/Helicase HerA, central domain